MNTPDQSTCVRCGRTILRGLNRWFAVGPDGYACGNDGQGHVPSGGTARVWRKAGAR